MRFPIAACLLLIAASSSAQLSTAVHNRFVYVNNQTQSNTISAYKIESDGALTQLANSPISTGGSGAEGPIESMAFAVTHAGSILYAANDADPSISAFLVNQHTGDIVPIAGSPFAVNDNVGFGPYDMASSPDNRFLFVTNGGNTEIHVYAIDPAMGKITEIAGSPFNANAYLSGLWVTANGKFLLGASSSVNAVLVFAIASSGEITQVSGSPFAANASVSDVRSNCASDRVFDADNGSDLFGSDLIDAYTMSSTGTLTPVPGSPFYNGATGDGGNSYDLALAPNGHFLYTTDSFADGLSSFAIAPNGALSLVNGSPFQANGAVGGMTITDRGDYLYAVAFQTATVVAEAVHPDGRLTNVGSYEDGQLSGGGYPNSVIAYPPSVCATVAAP
jgi:6-phosphogluconolactonase (cycloisomerase 2 family)